MGIYLGKLLSSTWWGNKAHKILMVGLDAVGTGDRFLGTTILYQLKLGQQGLIFVVDLNDKERIHEARDKLHAVLSDEKNHASLLVVANKQEIPGALSIPDVTAALGLHIIQERNYFVQGCSAKSGKGLIEGLEWPAFAIVEKEPYCMTYDISVW